LGPGPEKVCEGAIGIDFRPGPATDIRLDLSEPEALRLFASDSFDYVFSSHLLEHLSDTKGTLKEWWRVLRYGGHLILYCPDPEFYPQKGTEHANPEHRSDLTVDAVAEILQGFGDARIVHTSRHNDSNEYSWQLVGRKQFSLLRRPYEVVKQEVHKAWSWALPRVKKAAKECLVIRYGALGDAIWMTPVLRQLKADGWYVVYNTTEYSAQVLRECPYIDEFLIQPQDGVITSSAATGRRWGDTSTRC
jgi:SAM-dependent methyltransferase